VEHTQGGRVEEGEIHFQNGQPIYARVGQINGQDALNRLLTWQNIHFAFTNNMPGAAGNIAQITGPITTTSPIAPQNVNDTLKDNAILGTNSSKTVMRTQPAPIFSPSVNERAVPQKRRQVDDVTSLPLTRRQRYIYFLVDGRRSISALSRTTGQSVQEVELILRELQEQGLITV
jgi:hypothetical protein